MARTSYIQWDDDDDDDDDDILYLIIMYIMNFNDTLRGCHFMLGEWVFVA